MSGTAFENADITAENINSASLSNLPVTDKNTFMRNFGSIITVKNITRDMLRRFDEGTSEK